MLNINIDGMVIASARGSPYLFCVDSRSTEDLHLAFAKKANTTSKTFT